LVVAQPPACCRACKTASVRHGTSKDSGTAVAMTAPRGPLDQPVRDMNIGSRSQRVIVIAVVVALVSTAIGAFLAQRATEQSERAKRATPASTADSAASRGAP